MRAAAGLSGGVVPELIQSGGAMESGAADITLTGLQQNDVIFVFIAQQGSVLSTMNQSGYTLWYSNTSDNSATLVMYYKVVTSTPDTAIGVTAGAGGADGCAYTFYVYRGVNTSYPALLSNDTSGLTPPPILADVPTVAIAVAFCGGSPNAVITSGPSGYSNFLTYDSTAGSDADIGTATKIVSAGTETPGAFSTSPTFSSNYTKMVVVTPSSYVPPTPTFIASASTQNTANGSTLVINKPSGTVDGDLMVAIMTSTEAANATWSGDTGWTELADNGSAQNARVAYKVASSEGASYTFSTTSSKLLAGSILTYRGASYDAIGSFSSSTNPVVPTGPSAAENYSVLIGFASRLTGGVTGTAPTYMTTRVTDNDASSPSYVIADEIVGYGATGTRSFNLGSNSNNIGIMLTIKPA